MPDLRFPMILSLLLVAACQQDRIPAEQSSPASGEMEVREAEAEVREAVEQLTEAMNARDAHRVLAFYRQSREFIFLGCTDLMFGSEMFSRVLGPFWESRPDAPFEREVLQIQVLSPETAVVTLQGGSKTGSALFWTQVLVREADGRWLVTHEHQSWPGCREPPPLHTTGSLGDAGDPGIAP
jgi:uncharacterized protein (TIGR02246 family)